jgi:Helix-turn-helix
LNGEAYRETGAHARSEGRTLAASADPHFRTQRAEVRRQQDLSQQQLGDMADVSPNYLGQAERGVANAGCGGHEEFVELLTGMPGASWPVRRIVLIKRSGG